jgi:hypothetical protein
VVLVPSMMWLAAVNVFTFLLTNLLLIPVIM